MHLSLSTLFQGSTPAIAASESFLRASCSIINGWDAQAFSTQIPRIQWYRPLFRPEVCFRRSNLLVDRKPRFLGN